MSVPGGSIGVVTWTRDGDGQWTAAAVGARRYVIRGGPGTWWFELLNTAGVVLATGRSWGSPNDAQAEADARRRNDVAGGVGGGRGAWRDRSGADRCLGVGAVAPLILGDSPPT